MFAPFADLAKASAVQDYVAAMDSSVTVAIRDKLAALQVPTLVVWGTADEFFDPSWGRWLEEVIPGTVRRTELDGAKLFFPAERWQEFNLELRWLWSN
jgi:pimeloyl-ACP methyl ester carboxylesterase